MIGKRRILYPCGKLCKKVIDLEPPTLLIDQVYFGCTQKEAKVNHQAVRSKTELFRTKTTMREAKEND